MPRYADGFLLAVPKRKLDAYRRDLPEGRKNLEGTRRARVRRMRRRRSESENGPCSFTKAAKAEAGRRRSCFPGFSTSRAPIAIASTRR